MSAQAREVPAVSAPPIPSKYDIIPIHASDVGSFLRCRRYWAWSSPSKLNLRRRIDIAGINFPLWFGSGIHYALEMYYDPFLSRDPVEAFKTWYEYQWNGGIVTEDWLERCYDQNPEPAGIVGELGVGENGKLVQSTKTPILSTYKIKGLRELHPDPIHEEFEHHLDLGIGMLEFYKEYAAKNDEFIVVAAESTFSVPLGFEAIDLREESPNYGQSIEVHARGKRDAIIYVPRTERFGLIDHKTAASIEDEYFTKLEMDPQVNTYWWASQEEARIHDLPYKRLDGVLYNVLCKKYPRSPTILSDGISPSINRKDESTTAEIFAEYIREAGIQEIYDNNPKWQAYYNYLAGLGDRQYIERRVIHRNQHQVNAQGEHLRAIAREMLNPDVAVYPTPTSNWTCTRCQFRAPCLAADDGSDYVHLLADGYEQNVGR